MSAKQSILNYLKNGNTLTPRQAESKFKIRNASAAVSELRREGYPNIYTNVVTNSRGVKVQQYRYGRPTQAMLKEAKRGNLQIDQSVLQAFAN